MIDRLREGDIEQRHPSSSRRLVPYRDVCKKSPHVIRFFSHEIIHEFHVGFFGTESVNEKDVGLGVENFRHRG